MEQTGVADDLVDSVFEKMDADDDGHVGLRIASH